MAPQPGLAAPSPTWQGPSAGRRGGGCGRGLLILVLLALVAGSAAAYVLIAKPFGDGPAPSARPPALVSPSPTARTTVAPTPAPTAPATPAPTGAHSPEPTFTEAPAQTPAATDPGTATCRSETVGITVTYPTTLQAYSGDPRWDCLLFDPNPITIVPDSELPAVAVAIYADQRTAAEVEADFKTASVYTVIQNDSGEIDGRAAVAYEVENTGQGYYDKGVLELVVIVDRGTGGTLVLETVGSPGARYDANVELLGQIAQAIKID